MIPVFSSSFTTAIEVLKETTKVKLTHHNRAARLYEPYRSTSVWAMRRCIGAKHLQRVWAQSIKSVCDDNSFYSLALSIAHAISSLFMV